MEDAPAIPAEQEVSTNLSLLAKERFGDKYHGEVVEPAEAETTNEIPEEIEEPEEPPEEESFISSIDDLATFLQETQGGEIDPEWFESLQVQGKVNGEERTYTLGELKASVQMADAAQGILESAKEKAKAQQQELAQQSEQVTQHFAVASSLIENLEQAMMADAQRIDWAKLETEDPGEYSAKKIHFQERQAGIQQMKQEALQQYQQWASSQQEAVQQAQQEQLAAEHDALLQKLPEWQNPTVAEKERTELTKYLVNTGFSTEELNHVADHRLLVMARKAWLYDQNGVSQTEAKAKKIAKIPRTLTPGPTKTPAQVNQADLDAKRARLKKSGNIRDAFEYMQAKKNAR